MPNSFSATTSGTIVLGLATTLDVQRCHCSNLEKTFIEGLDLDFFCSPIARERHAFQQESFSHIKSAEILATQEPPRAVLPYQCHAYIRLGGASIDTEFGVRRIRHLHLGDFDPVFSGDRCVGGYRREVANQEEIDDQHCQADSSKNHVEASRNDVKVGRGCDAHCASKTLRSL